MLDICDPLTDPIVCDLNLLKLQYVTFIQKNICGFFFLHIC